MLCRFNAARLHALGFGHSNFSFCVGRHFSAPALPNITNEPFLHYAPGSAERSSVLAACKSAREECPDIPLVINGQAVRTGDIGRQVCMTVARRQPFYCHLPFSHVKACSGHAQRTRPHSVHLSSRISFPGSNYASPSSAGAPIMRSESVSH
jgi:hypothetical protein